MKKYYSLSVLMFFYYIAAAQQTTIIKGEVVDALSLKPVFQASVHVQGTSFYAKTDENGSFGFNNIDFGKYVLVIEQNGYISQSFPITVLEFGIVDLDRIYLEQDISIEQTDSLLSLADNDFSNDNFGTENTAGLLQATKDVFLKTAAFEFSSSFFNVRGLGSENGEVLLNGVPMNKQFNGRPQWGNWGGLNDVMRNQEFSNGLDPSDYGFGGILGMTNFNLRASQARKGSSVSYAATNRSYANRVMATHASGLTKSGWAYTISLGRRWGNQGFVDGTIYDANSFFVSVEKKINDKHGINLTGIYTPNRRGRSSPNTQEVFDLRGIRYNEYWGYQEGEIRNSRIKEVSEPIIMLNHYWDIDDKSTLNTNIAYQFGKQGSSRLDFRNANNPSPAYYRKLPSYGLSFGAVDFEEVFTNEQAFVNDGQLDWNSLYNENIGDTSVYVLYEDRTDDAQLTANTIFRTSISKLLTINASIHYRKLLSENFAELTDLLGGESYINTETFDGYQFDLQDPDRIVMKGDRFRYNYNISSETYGGFAQLQASYDKLEYFMAGSVGLTSYQREGLFQSEAYADNSLGKGERLEFLEIGGKAGFTYNLSGRHSFKVNVGYVTQAPSIRNTYANARESHDMVQDIKEEVLTVVNTGYIFRLPKLKGRITSFYSTTQDASEISFYFTDGIGGDNAAFVQEILQGVRKKYLGGELGIESQITSTIKIKGAVSFGQYTYDNDPQLYLSSQDFEEGILRLGKANLKNYKLANGPHRAYSAGFEYRDPDYWWFSSTANVFSNAYIDISPLSRSNNFFMDNDGLPINDIDNALARELLRQERFDPYMIINAVGGKSWRIDDYYLGFFASINNILNTEYKTGGFEQGRSANYIQLRDDNALERRVFGPKYWYGRGTNFFMGTFFRF